MSHSPPPNLNVHVAMRRRILALEEENAKLVSKLVKRPVQSYVREGRAIRRLVSLSDPVADLIHEHDRRVLLVDDPNDIEDMDSTDRQGRIYRSYKKLVEWCPSIVGLMQACDADALEHACVELRKGADCARGDDTNNLKRSTTIWLNSQIPRPDPLLGDNKEKRGFYHDVTGGLICPVDYDWTDPVVRDAVRHYNQRYPVTAHMWPSFLYTKGQYQRNRPSLGLFRSELLLRAFRCIFTSPSSAAREETQIRDEGAVADEGPLGRRSSHIRTRRNVATLIKMKKVEPRAIAYVAIQLRFALSSCSSWDLQDDNFDYEVFYNNILDWFERSTTRAKAQLIEDLLIWWNEKIFGRRQAVAAAVHEQDVASLSVAASMG